MGIKAIKYALAAMVTAAGLSAPAMADPAIWVSNVQVPSGLYNVSTSAGSLYYVGAITYTVNLGTSYQTPTTDIPVWCDDLYNDVYIGSSDQYYQSDMNAYLSPLSSAQIDDMAGLAFEGDQNLTDANFDAAIQMAIWEVEYPGLIANDAGLQASVSALIAGASGWYGAMISANYLYSELESPGCNQAPGSITYTNGCQTQGQIFVYPNPNGNGNPCQQCRVPEPSSLGLLGSGLIASGLFGSGLAGWRRRKSTKLS